MDKITKRKVVLLILDGWGLSPELKGNAVINAKTPVIDTLIRNGWYRSLQAAGEAVGLPWGEMGNSEVGHINIGSGRVVLSDYSQIDQIIKNKNIIQNNAIKKIIERGKNHKSTVHIIGMLSNSSVHGNIEHTITLARLMSNNNLEVVFHLISDGRDTAPKIAQKLANALLTEIESIKNIRIGTICGRYYAMDRDKRWDRTLLAFEAISNGKGEESKDLNNAIEQSYSNNKTDEFIKPTVIGDPQPIKNDDIVIFTNFRADRAIQLSQAFMDKKIYFVTMTNYQEGSSSDSIFNVLDLNNSKINPLSNPLSKIISNHGLKQLHMAETEKYAHVTYFLNAGEKKPFPKEKQVLINSPKVSTYDLKPEMSANLLTKKFINIFGKIQPDFSVINFANADMVGHTGKLSATIKACESIDKNIGFITESLVNSGTDLIISSDHGKAEQMISIDSDDFNKEHTTNPVPFIYLNNKILSDNTNFIESSKSEKIKFANQKPIGLLADIAPTILKLLNLQQPSEMTGQNLLPEKYEK